MSCNSWSSPLVEGDPPHPTPPGHPPGTPPHWIGWGCRMWCTGGVPYCGPAQSLPRATGQSSSTDHPSPARQTHRQTDGRTDTQTDSTRSHNRPHAKTHRHTDGISQMWCNHNVSAGGMSCRAYKSVGECLRILLEVDVVAVVPSGLVHPKCGVQSEEEA